MVFSILFLYVFTFAMGTNTFATPIPIKVGEKIQISGGAMFYATISGGRGGPYTAFSPHSSWENFLAFCLKIDEYLNFSSTFLVSGITKAADNGGKNANAGDPLNDLTAYINIKAVNYAYGGDQLDDVRVINLTDLSGALRQDLLVTTPVPEPNLMLLFGIGIVGVAGLKRKFKQS
jgi:hypothetical protein